MSGCVETPSVDLTVPGDAGPPPAPEQLRIDGCTGLVGNFEAPRGAVEAALPDAFHLSDTGLAFVNVQFEALRCARASTSTAVVSEVALFHTFVRVTPTDPTWSGERSNRYQFDALVSTQDLATALADLGVRAPVVEFHAEAPPTRQVWQFDGMGTSAEVNFGTFGSPEGVSPVPARVHLWHEENDAFRRIDVVKSYRFESGLQQSGILRTEGLIVSAFAAGTVAWAGQAYAADDEIWSGEWRVFVA